MPTPTPTPTPTPSAPVNLSLPVITGTRTKGQTLTVSSGAWLNSPTSYDVQWKSNGVNVGTNLNTYALVAGDVGATITCVVTATNAVGSSSAAAAGVGPVIDLVPINTAAPVLSGTATVGQVLTVTNGTWTNTPTGYAYDWKRNGVSLGASSVSTYTPVSGDVGTNISCTVTASNSGGSAAATSNSLGPVGTTAGVPVPSGNAQFLNSGDGTGTAVTAPVVGQPLYIDPGPFTNTPTSYDYQVYSAGVAIPGETGTFTAAGDAYYLVTDDQAGNALSVKCHGINGTGTSVTTSNSVATSAVANIDGGDGTTGTIPNAITAFSRTSSSGDNTNAFGMQVSITFGSNVYEGMTLRASAYSDSGLTTQTQSVAHILSNADLQSGADIPAVLLADGLTKLGITDWLTLGVEATSPHGTFFSYTFGTAISPTDAVVAMTLSASDKSAGIGLAGGNLFAAQGGAPGGARTNRGVSSGKFYVEFVAATAQINLYDSSASLTVDQEVAANGGTPSVHAAVYSSPYGTINFNATNASVTSFSGAVFIAGISGTTMTVSNAAIGTLAVGQYVAGPGIAWGTKINSFGTGSGGNGTYIVNISQTVVDDGTFFVGGPLIGMAVDATADKIAWALNNTWLNSANPSAGTGMLSISGISKPVFPAINLPFNGYRVGFFPGTTPGTTTGFAFTPPTGFLAP